MRKLNSVVCGECPKTGRSHHWILDSCNKVFCLKCGIPYENWRVLEKYDKVCLTNIIDPEIMMARIPGYPKRWVVPFQW